MSHYAELNSPIKLFFATSKKCSPVLDWSLPCPLLSPAIVIVVDYPLANYLALIFNSRTSVSQSAHFVELGRITACVPRIWSSKGVSPLSRGRRIKVMWLFTCSHNCVLRDCSGLATVDCNCVDSCGDRVAPLSGEELYGIKCTCNAQLLYSRHRFPLLLYNLCSRGVREAVQFCKALRKSTSNHAIM